MVNSTSYRNVYNPDIEFVAMTALPPPKVKTLTVSLYKADPALVKNIRQLRLSLKIDEPSTIKKLKKAALLTFFIPPLSLLLWATADEKMYNYKASLKETYNKHMSVRNLSLEGITDKKFEALFDSVNGLGYLQKERNVSVYIEGKEYKTLKEITKALGTYQFSTVELYTTLMMCTGGFPLMQTQLNKAYPGQSFNPVDPTKNKVTIEENEYLALTSDYDMRDLKTGVITGKKSVEMRYDIKSENCTFKIRDLKFEPLLEADDAVEEPGYDEEEETVLLDANDKKYVLREGKKEYL